MCDITHCYTSSHSFLFVTWLTCILDMTRCYVSRHMSWRRRYQGKSLGMQWNVLHCASGYFDVWHDSLVCATSRNSTWDMIHVVHLEVVQGLGFRHAPGAHARLCRRCSNSFAMKLIANCWTVCNTVTWFLLTANKKHWAKTNLE